MEGNPLAQLLHHFQKVGRLKIPWEIQELLGVWEAKVNLSPLGVSQVVTGRDGNKKFAKKIAATNAIKLLGSAQSDDSSRWILPFIAKGRGGKMIRTFGELNLPSFRL